MQNLSTDELQKLLTEVENKSKEGKGIFSKGRLLDGYAIDKETLESLQSVHHDTVGFELAANISDKLISAGADFNSSDVNKILYKRIVKGFVYLEVSDFKTPIVKLYLGVEEMGNKVPEADVEKISNHIKNERKLLPISADFQVL